MSRRQTLRARRELRAARINARHTKTARRVHDKAEAVIKARDEQRRIEHIIDNAAEHVAAIVRGD